ncbi:MAG: hypothetical protein J6M39_06675 [Lachnospiraceae bacterium]|nr:hypothetical protein [Lachnospiraceae bacterium]
MEFGYFIALIGLIVLLICSAIKFKGQLTPKDPTCPNDVKESKITAKSKTILIVIGSILLIGGICLVIFG